MKKLIAAILVFSSFSPLYAEEIPGQTLLNYFSSNCRTQGEWTRAALADSVALVETLKSLSSDPACKTVGGAVSQLGMLNNELTNMQNLNTIQTQIAELDAKEQELMAHLTQTTNADTITAINGELRTIQVSRAGLLSQEDSHRNLAGTGKGRAMANVIKIANSAMTQLIANQSCLTKNPSLLSGAATVMSAVGATAMMVNPALGIGLTAGGELLGQTIEGVRQYREARSIREITDNTIALEAYKCALESMSDKFCQIQDAKSLLAFKASQRVETRNTGLSEAMRLNDREIPVFIEWLGNVASGVEPTTGAEAERLNRIYLRENPVRSFHAAGNAYITERIFLYQSATSAEERWTIIKGIVNTLASGMLMPVTSPFFELVNPGYAPFYLLGIREDDTSIRNEEGYLSLDLWEKPSGFSPDPEFVRGWITDWVRKAETRVNQERNQVLQPDTERTLAMAFDQSGNRFKISPMKALGTILQFLEQNQPGEDDRAYRKIYASTVTTLAKIKDITETSYFLKRRFAGGPVEEIYNIAQLKYGTIVLSARLEMIIRLALLELLEQSPEEDQVLVAQLLAAERMSETIKTMTGLESLTQINASLNRGQGYQRRNLNSFLDIFGKNISKTLERLYKSERNSTGSTALSWRRDRAELCFLLLSVEDVNQYVKTGYCHGLQLETVLPGGPVTPALTSADYRLDLEKRACTYREFFRKSKIFENWGIK